MSGVKKLLKKEVNSKKELAFKYFSILSVWNNLQLTKRELELLCHISIRGSINSYTSKKEFSELYETTIATADNMMSKLLKKGILVKEAKKVLVNPVIRIDFSKTFAFVFDIICFTKN